MSVCRCDRVVRLDLRVGNEYVWICCLCNAQFVPKKAVDYKLSSLVGELERRMISEQGSGVRIEGPV